MSARLFVLAAFLASRVTAFAADPHDLVIALDIGHTRARPGAVSARGAYEFYFNQRMARLIEQRLREAGYRRVFLINESGRDISLTERTALAARKKAALFLSIHHDSVQPRYVSPWLHDGRPNVYSDRFQGYSVFYSERNRAAAESRTLALAIGSELLASGLTPTLHHAEPIPGENRRLIDARTGVYQFDELVVLWSAKMPAVLLECGVLAHRQEELNLETPEYRDRIAAAVVRAINRWTGASRPEALGGRASREP